MPPRFYTKAYEEVAQYEQQEKEKKAEIEANRKEMQEKKDNYGRYVRQTFLPEVSKEKELERKSVIQ